MEEIDVLVAKLASVDQYLTTEVLEDIASSIKTDVTEAYKEQLLLIHQLKGKLERLSNAVPVNKPPKRSNIVEYFTTSMSRHSSTVLFNEILTMYIKDMESAVRASTGNYGVRLACSMIYEGSKIRLSFSLINNPDLSKTDVVLSLNDIALMDLAAVATYIKRKLVKNLEKEQVVC